MGLVDQLVDTPSLERVAIDAAAGLAAGTLKPKRRRKSLVNRLIENNPVGRAVMWRQVWCAFCEARKILYFPSMVFAIFCPGSGKSLKETRCHERAPPDFGVSLANEASRCEALR